MYIAEIKGTTRYLGAVAPSTDAAVAAVLGMLDSEPANEKWFGLSVREITQTLPRQARGAISARFRIDRGEEGTMTGRSYVVPSLFGADTFDVDVEWWIGILGYLAPSGVFRIEELVVEAPPEPLPTTANS